VEVRLKIVEILQIKKVIDLKKWTRKNKFPFPKIACSKKEWKIHNKNAFCWVLLCYK
jgi:hypothetical protein